MSKRMHMSDGIPVARWIGSSIGDWACVLFAGGLGMSVDWGLIIVLFDAHPALGILSALLSIIFSIIASFVIDFYYSGTDTNDNSVMMIIAYLIGGQFIFGQLFLVGQRFLRTQRKMQRQRTKQPLS